eukprot:COSAG03_NODE_22396_length_291_cov_1.083333_1_plen_43_part_10
MRASVLSRAAVRALDPDTRLIGCTQAFGASGGSFAMSGTEAPE